MTSELIELAKDTKLTTQKFGILKYSKLSRRSNILQLTSHYIAIGVQKNFILTCKRNGLLLWEDQSPQLNCTCNILRQPCWTLLTWQFIKNLSSKISLSSWNPKYICLCGALEIGDYKHLFVETPSSFLIIYARKGDR